MTESIRRRLFQEQYERIAGQPKESMSSDVSIARSDSIVEYNYKENS
jgi:hypothetical protein